MASNLERSKAFFTQFDHAHLDLLDQFYDKDVRFQDPVHQLQGRDALRGYYAGLYENVESIHFDYGDSFESHSTVTLTWKMRLKTPALEGGREITVDGVSLITFGGAEGKAIAHRDYFDMGEFIYEHVPLLRSLVRYIKGRLAG